MHLLRAPSTQAWTPPGMEHHSFSGQPVPLPHCPLSEEFLLPCECGTKPHVLSHPHVHVFKGFGQELAQPPSWIKWDEHWVVCIPSLRCTTAWKTARIFSHTCLFNIPQLTLFILSWIPAELSISSWQQVSFFPVLAKLGINRIAFLGSLIILER